MTKIDLSAFVQVHGRETARQLIGVSYSALTQMLASEREIFVVPQEDGSYKAFETKEIKSIDRTGRRKTNAA